MGRTGFKSWTEEYHRSSKFANWPYPKEKGDKERFYTQRGESNVKIEYREI